MKHFFTVICALGLEDVLVEELKELGMDDLQKGRSVVFFTGSLEDGYRACLWSRVASRVLLHVKSCPAPNANALYNGVRKIAWRRHLGAENTLAVSFVGTSSTLRNTQFSAQKVKDAIVDCIRDAEGERPNVDPERPDVRVYVHLRNDKATISIDLSGEPLHLRGHQRDGGIAPLKETLAAGLLRIAGWPERAKRGEALVDPMCGSGTFLLEAADVLANRAPGLCRPYWGFTSWRGHEPLLWKSLVKEAEDAVLTPSEPIQIFGFDNDPQQLKRARKNLGRADLADWVDLQFKEFSEQRPPLIDAAPYPSGIMISNPPYGERVGDEDAIAELWPTIGNVLRRQFNGWTGFLLAGGPEQVKLLGLRPKRRHVVFNGAIECRFLQVPISPKKVARDVVNTEEPPTASPGERDV